MIKARSVGLALSAVLVAGLGTSACSQQRWCEHDASDTVVSDRYCKNKTPGYEWETGTHKKQKKHKKHKRHSSH
ncbi:hypothetical protein [Actinomadura xylanilytica]|uniref:hypothetical protein n=1 Tax=Actinomadura xylanilytica TaxID=887459 RepID=UPI00255AE680|nr:hypothetical protein [Actinomadura xylanilytica]MDL4773389.1 hypothetical protein [Actinomadura xylanilytica]